MADSWRFRYCQLLPLGMAFEIRGIYTMGLYSFWVSIVWIGSIIYIDLNNYISWLIK